MKTLLNIIGYCLTVWPYRVQIRLGRALGLLSYYVAKKRRDIAFKNITHCFPEWTVSEHRALCRENFKRMGMGVTESFAAWMMSERRIAKIPCSWLGEENFKAALKTGKGVIALSAHFTCMEMMGRIIGKKLCMYYVYKASRNKAVDEFICKGRLRSSLGLLKHSNMRGVVAALRAKKVVWFAPDQDFGRVQAEFVPFCGVPAATINAASVLARLGDAVVLPMFFHRTKNGYELVTFPPWENFPSGDYYADAKRYNDLLTVFVRQYPAEYFWVHRRFKTTESGQNFYN